MLWEGFSIVFDMDYVLNKGLYFYFLKSIGGGLRRDDDFWFEEFGRVV